jgi:hypothetical protein
VAAPKNPGGNAGKGRKTGVPNKLNRDIKEMIHTALHKAGGVAYLTRQATENPGPFLTLLGKILPTQVNATIKTEAAELTDAELMAYLTQTAEIASALNPVTLRALEALPTSSHNVSHDLGGTGGARATDETEGSQEPSGLH